MAKMTEKQVLNSTKKKLKKLRIFKIMAGRGDGAPPVSFGSLLAE